MNSETGMGLGILELPLFPAFFALAGTVFSLIKNGELAGIGGNVLAWVLIL